VSQVYSYVRYNLDFGMMTVVHASTDHIILDGCEFITLACPSSYQPISGQIDMDCVNHNPPQDTMLMIHWIVA